MGEWDLVRADFGPRIGALVSGAMDLGEDLGMEVCPDDVMERALIVRVLLHNLGLMIGDLIRAPEPFRAAFESLGYRFETRPFEIVEITDV